eukprot:6189486-Pleurochrysis_carterae.AAC.3
MLAEEDGVFLKNIDDKRVQGELLQLDVRAETSHALACTRIRAFAQMTIRTFAHNGMCAFVRAGTFNEICMSTHAHTRSGSSRRFLTST